MAFRELGVVFLQLFNNEPLIFFLVAVEIEDSHQNARDSWVVVVLQAAENIYEVLLVLL